MCFSFFLASLPNIPSWFTRCGTPISSIHKALILLPTTLSSWLEKKETIREICQHLCLDPVYVNERAHIWTHACAHILCSTLVTMYELSLLLSKASSLLVTRSELHPLALHPHHNFPPNWILSSTFSPATISPFFISQTKPSQQKPSCDALPLATAPHSVSLDSQLALQHRADGTGLSQVFVGYRI